MVSNELIISHFTRELKELIPASVEHFGDLDGYGDYLGGVIETQQRVLRMMGVPEDQIPTDGSC